MPEMACRQGVRAEWQTQKSRRTGLAHENNQFSQPIPCRRPAGGSGAKQLRPQYDARQADVMSMPLNSPLAMRFSHSAGPVMWALVPPASTATVTGMSTTSNS